MLKVPSRVAAAGTVLVAALVLSAATAQADKCTALRLKAIGKRESRTPHLPVQGGPEG